MRERPRSVPTGWSRRGLRAAGIVAAVLILTAASHAGAQSPPLELHKNDRVVLLGNTMAERLQQFNYFETLLVARFPDLDLVVRNLGWSGDTITLQPRPLNFGDAAKHLRELKPDVILAFFGLDESFEGEAGLSAFEKNLDQYLTQLLQAEYSEHGPVRLALVSPMAHEQIARLAPFVNAEVRNRELGRYTEAMRKAAAARHVTFVDLFTPSKALMARETEPLTDNGIHVNEAGDRAVAQLLMEGLGFTPKGTAPATAAALKELEPLRVLVREKNQQFFYRWRPVNAEYVVGRRVEPFGAVNFPTEMRELDDIVSECDQRIWAQARATRAPQKKGGEP